MKNNSLINEASTIAQFMYKVADEIETNDSDEKWRSVSKIKNSANDAYFYVAQVVGAGSSQSQEYDCINAKKHLITLKSMYIFASKQDLTTLDPELVVRIDKLVATIDTEQTLSQSELKRKSDEELKPWLEKYRIWQKISKD
jgi:site-specific recombinase XerD